MIHPCKDPACGVLPVQEFAERLVRGHHAGHRVVAAQQASRFGLQAGPDARAQLAQQLAEEHPVLQVGGDAAADAMSGQVDAAGK
jgi:hypothetical protein